MKDWERTGGQGPRPRPPRDLSRGGGLRPGVGTSRIREACPCGRRRGVRPVPGSHGEVRHVQTGRGPSAEGGRRRRPSGKVHPRGGGAGLNGRPEGDIAKGGSFKGSSLRRRRSVRRQVEAPSHPKGGTSAGPGPTAPPDVAASRAYSSPWRSSRLPSRRWTTSPGADRSSFGSSSQPSCWRSSRRQAGSDPLRAGRPSPVDPLLRMARIPGRP